MGSKVLQIRDVSKMYRLGEVGTGSLSHDLNRWYARMRGKEDPFQKLGTVNDRRQQAVKGESVWALRDISFDVNQGEVLGIIGKNGAGKSTLLKVLSRITSPTSGRIDVRGRIASLLEVGTGFHPEMTGRENIYMNGTIMGMTRSEIHRKLDDIVSFAGVAKYLDTPVKRYSSGMTVRLGFAVAAFLEPEILIVDEVLAVGDAEFQKLAIGKMKDVSSEEGRTVLFVSHNMVAVRSFCDRGILLENGTVSKIGEIIPVVDHYLKGSYAFLGDQRTIAKNGVLIKSYEVQAANDQDVLYTHEAFEINIVLMNEFNLQRRLDISLVFKYETGEDVFVTSTLFQDSDSTLTPGAERLFRVNVPADLLNVGMFLIDLQVIENGSKVIVRENDFLQINLTNSKLFSKGWLGKTRGSIRPNLKWQIDSL